MTDEDCRLLSRAIPIQVTEHIRPDQNTPNIPVTISLHELPQTTQMTDTNEAVLTARNRLGSYATEESLAKGTGFKPGPDDVFVCAAPRSGTTWMQQICHGLRTRGSMDFEEMSLVFPIIENAHDYGYTDLHKEQVAKPHMFKTHFPYRLCPKGAGKYIYVLRDPKDAGVSLYHFFNGWFLDLDSISMEDYMLKMFAQRGFYDGDDFTHWLNIASWYPHRNDSNVLWLHFEDLKEDLPACVKLVAEFLDIGAQDEELQALVTKQASMEFMKQHQTKFDEHSVKRARNPAVGLPVDLGSENKNVKIRSGEIGESEKVLPQHVLDELDAVWKEQLEPVTGYASYQELRAGVNKELGRPFGSAVEI